MKILSRNSNLIVNSDNLIEIVIENQRGVDEQINVIEKSFIKGKGINCSIELGVYDTEVRAKEILLDIYSKLSENKTVYKMPTK